MSQLPQELLYLLQQLYGPAQPLSPADLATVQSSLFDAQRRPEGWSYASAGLSDLQVDAHVRFYAASTLSYKVTHDLASLGADDRVGLRHSTLRWLAASTEIAFERPGSAAVGERVVARKLASTLASLITTSRKKQEWPSWPAELRLALSAQPLSLLEVLAVLAEDKAVQEEDWDSLHLTDALVSALYPAHPACRAGLRCLAALVTTKTIPQASLASVYPRLPPLLPLTDCVDLAASIIEDCLISFTSFAGFMGKTQVDGLARTYAGPLAPAFAQLSQGECELDIALIKLFATLMETLILDDLATSLSDPAFQQLLRSLFHLTTTAGAFPVDEELSNVAFPLWLLLQEEASAAGVGETGENQAAWPIVRDAFSALLPALLRKTTWPDDASSWPKDIQQQFRNYREEANGVMLAVYYVLRQPVLDFLVDQLVAPGVTDETTEAALVALLGFARTLLRRASGRPASLSPFERLFSTFTFGSRSDTRIRLTELRLISDCATLFTDNQQHLLPLMNVVVTALQDQELARDAASALQELCDRCGDQLVHHLGAFSELVSSQRDLLPPAEYATLLGAVGSLLRSMPPHDAFSYTLAISQQVTEQLVAGIAQLTPAADATLPHAKPFIAFANRIVRKQTVFLRFDDDANDFELEPSAGSAGAETRTHAEDPPAVQSIRRLTLQALDRLAAVCVQSNSVELQEALDDICLATTATSKPPTPLSLDAMLVMEATSACSTQSLWLFAITRLVGGISKDVKESNADPTRFANVYRHIVQSALQACSASLDDAELPEALLMLEAEVIRFLPRVVDAAPNLVDASLSLCERVLQLPDPGPRQSAITFISLLIFDEAEATRPLLVAHGRSILHIALSRFIADHASIDVGPFAELVNVFVTRLPDVSRAAMGEIMAAPGWPTGEEERNRFLTSVLRARTSKATLTAMDALFEEF